MEAEIRRGSNFLLLRAVVHLLPAAQCRGSVGDQLQVHVTAPYAILELDLVLSLDLLHLSMIFDIM